LSRSAAPIRFWIGAFHSGLDRFRRGRSSAQPRKNISAQNMPPANPPSSTFTTSLRHWLLSATVFHGWASAMGIKMGHDDILIAVLQRNLDTATEPELRERLAAVIERLRKRESEHGDRAA
jgi:hypothetical protein